MESLKEALIKILDNDYIEIKKISICATHNQFKQLKEQGFNVSWMGEYENKKYVNKDKDKELFAILIEE